MAESSDFATSVSPLPHLEAVKSLLTLSYIECSERGLLCSAQWSVRAQNSAPKAVLCLFNNAARPSVGHVIQAPSSLCRCIELAQSLSCQLPEVPQPQMEELLAAEYMEYSSAKALYDMREFKRAAHTLQNCRSKKSFFLRCYCMYLVCDVVGYYILYQWVYSCDRSLGKTLSRGLLQRPLICHLATLKPWTAVT